MKAWWHSLVTVGVAVFATVAPLVQTAIGSHPKVSIVIGTIWAVLGHILPSPIKTAVPAA